mgnify:CR=1 FL=1
MTHWTCFVNFTAHYQLPLGILQFFICYFRYTLNEPTNCFLFCLKRRRYSVFLSYCWFVVVRKQKHTKRERKKERKWANSRTGAHLNDNDNDGQQERHAAAWFFILCFLLFISFFLFSVWACSHWGHPAPHYSLLTIIADEGDITPPFLSSSSLSPAMQMALWSVPDEALCRWHCCWCWCWWCWCCCRLLKYRSWRRCLLTTVLALKRRRRTFQGTRQIEMTMHRRKRERRGKVMHF